MPKATGKKAAKAKPAAPKPQPKDDTPSPPVIVDDTIRTTGDFTLVSSDDVRFRVDSMALFVSSPIFREASEMSSGDKFVHLTDPDFETADVVRAFLDFVLEFKSEFRWDAFKLDVFRGPPAPINVPSPVVSLAWFMHKYECHLDLKRLLYVFGKEQNDYNYPAFTRDWFILAALAKDNLACAAAIQRTQTNIIGLASNTRSGGNSYKDAAALIPNNMSAAIKNTIPNEYLAALVKGWERSGQDRSRSEWARQFGVYLGDPKVSNGWDEGVYGRIMRPS